MANLIYFTILIAITIIFFIIDAISHQKFKRKANLIFHILGIALLTILISFLILSEFKFTFLIYPGVLLILISLILIYLSFIEIKPNFLKAEKITTKGIYTKIRHPMYLGLIILFIAFPLITSSLLVLLYSLLVIVLFIWLSNYEEKALEKKFGKKYLAYKEKVPMFIPKLTKKYNS